MDWGRLGARTYVQQIYNADIIAFLFGVSYIAVRLSLRKVALNRLVSQFVTATLCHSLKSICHARKVEYHLC